MSDSPSKRSSSRPRCFSSDILSRCGPGVQLRLLLLVVPFHSAGKKVAPSQKRLAPTAFADSADVSEVIPLQINGTDSACSPVTGRFQSGRHVELFSLLFTADGPLRICLSTRTCRPITSITDLTVQRSRLCAEESGDAPCS
ncbi:hypothetical protein F2P81_014443 [Scophthalmus maximus]|uniref:Uncharacterized protein n=1 Tax=Scophthalmus maximus TaxID=52904 RepID=A0A6A4SDB3_SCOMX|nr:hypothetical protein F2P81_014443 [Scophthalmus maximus]